LILLQQRVESYQNFSENSLNKREDTQNSVLTTCSSLESQNLKLSDEFREMNLKREELQKEFNQLEERFKEKCLEEDRLKGELKIKESEIFNFQAQMKNFEEIERFIRNLQKEKENLEEERNKLRGDFKETIENFSKEIFLKDEEISKKDEEISKLSSTIIEKNEEISRLSGQNERKTIEINELQSSVEELTRAINAYKDLQRRCETFEELLKKHQSECVSLHSAIALNQASYKSSIFDLNLEKTTQLQMISALHSEISKLSTEVHEKLTLYRSEQIITQELRSKSTIIQQKLCNTLDVNKLFNQVKYLSTSMTELRDKLVEDNDELVRQVLQITEDYLNAGKVIQQVRDIIEDRDNEINILRDLIAELQNKTIYYPVKDDPVDEAIADYLNSRSEPLPVTFIREEYGLYLFGTKRVFIKLENNRIISKG
jgi:chromosome segregation ATPase